MHSRMTLLGVEVGAVLSDVVFSGGKDLVK